MLCHKLVTLVVLSGPGRSTPKRAALALQMGGEAATSVAECLTFCRAWVRCPIPLLGIDITVVLLWFVYCPEIHIKWN